MTMSQEMAGSTPGGRPERFTPYRGVGSHGNGAPESEEHPNGTVGYESERLRLPSLDLATPPEPVLGSDRWWDPPSGALADHPLLRGLLLELPPKGSTPPPGWLDRWFEATRSILELLYVQNHS